MCPVAASAATAAAEGGGFPSRKPFNSKGLENKPDGTALALNTLAMPLRTPMTWIIRIAAAALVAVHALASGTVPAAAASRIKDLANVEGVRQNQLIGYGLVVGLNGTGDSLNNAPFPNQSLQAMPERLAGN